MFIIIITIWLPRNISVGEANIPVVLSVRNLGLIITAYMALKKQVAVICQSDLL